SVSQPRWRMLALCTSAGSSSKTKGAPETLEYAATPATTRTVACSHGGMRIGPQYKGGMAYRAVFRCIAGCHGDHPLDQPIYRCPQCGDLLEVVHDLEALKSRSAAAWMKLFDDRYKRTTWPYGSAGWGKKEWVAPH